DHGSDDGRHARRGRSRHHSSHCAQLVYFVLAGVYRVGRLLLLAQLMDPLAAAQSSLPRCFVCALAFRSSARDLRPLPTRQGGARGRNKCDHLDLRRTRLRVHRTDGRDIIRQYGSTHQPTRMVTASYGGLVLHLADFREQLSVARGVHAGVHSGRSAGHIHSWPAHRRWHLTGAREAQSSFITTESVSTGSSKRAMSPAFLPGTRKRRAERGLRRRVAREATSRRRAWMVAGDVLPGMGTTSRPVPQTLEYSSTSRML